MKLLFVGDVVGSAGQRILLNKLPVLRDRLRPDVVVVNAENAAGGFGVTEKIANELFERGVNVITTGNHVWDKKETLDHITREARLLRPHNFPPHVPGSGWFVAKSVKGHAVGVLNLMGNLFMHPTLDCPFACVDALLATKPDSVRIVLVDFHAETTSEKMAMGWHLDGRVSAVLGTHTHVPTADERVLPRGTAFVSDVGMTGCYDSVIGMDKTKALRRLVQKLPERFEAAEGRASLCGALVEVDETTGKSTGIQRIRVEE